MAYDVVVELEEEKVEEQSEHSPLASWVMGHVRDWQDYRDSNFDEKWKEYYRLWRGIWADGDKSRESERSRLISPALQQAIEMSVAELEEATFGRGRWFDVSDDVSDQEKQDMEIFRNLLMEDLDKAGVPSAVSEVFLNSAIYGTGIGKLYVEEEEEKVLVSNFGAAEAEPETVFKVGLMPIRPQDFSIDPAARTIDEALGCEHTTFVPRHTVIQKQQMGIYMPGDVGCSPDDEDLVDTGEFSSSKLSDKVKITEYHGLVPRELLPMELDEDEEVVDLGFSGEKDYITDETDLVEAIVTIANDGFVLKAVENPLIMQDRAFIAFPYDIVPNRFWGRGVAEKGYNSQKALDAEMRARIDAMALSIHPMMAVDATRLPRGGDLSVRPGRTILTNGDPNTILRPFNFGQVNPNTFTQSGELERMVQMSTGAMDSATPTSVAPRNATLGGMSMIMGGAIKRSKRTMANIERLFTKPLIMKSAWRYMQFDPERYPVRDTKFTVHSTLGIMARELEQQQLTTLLQTMPQESPGYWMLMRSIYENSSISNKEQMLAIIDQLLAQSMNPPQPQPDPKVILEQQKLQLSAQNDAISRQIELQRANTEQARVLIEASKADSQEAKNTADSILSLAKAEAAAAGTQLQQYKLMVDALQAQSNQEAISGRTEATRVPTGPIPSSGMETLQ